MPSIGRRGSAGFSVLEFMVVAIIIAVLAAALLQALRFAQRGAERQGFDDNRAVLQRAINHEALRRIAAGEQRNDASLRSANPFTWLQPKPPGWAGEYPASGKTAPGAWYWDSRAAQIVYVPKNPDHVEFPDSGRREIRLRLEIAAEGSGARLLPVKPFAWR